MAEGTERKIFEIPNPTLEESKDVGLAYFQETISSYTLPIAANSRDVRTKWGSAVLIEIGGRLFAATASHCIGRNLFLLLNRAFQLPTNPTPTRSIFKLDQDMMDIAAVELENDARLSRCSVENIAVDRPVVPADETKPGRPFYYVCGFPSAEYRWQGGEIHIRAISLATFPQSISPDVYKFAYPTTVSERFGDQFIDKPAGTPHGFSGGGLWKFHPPEPGEIYSPRNARLYGIQYEWHDNDDIDKGRRIYCVPIRHWINLIASNYPDLRGALSQFAMDA